jgi:acetolactate synthase-1/2/3 large subunit
MAQQQMSGGTVGLGWDGPPAEDWGEVIVSAMAQAGVDRVFFTSGTEIGFYQEAIARGEALGQTVPRLTMVTHEYVCLNAALGYAAVSGKPVVSAAHVDVGTQHYGCAIHTASRNNLPVLITAGAPPVALSGAMRGGRDLPHFWTQQTYDQNAIVRQYMKWEHRLEYQDNPGLVVSRALQVACSEPRGPVYLSLPRELVLLQNAPAFPTMNQLGVPRSGGPDAEGIRIVAERLVGASNPIIVSGCGRDPTTIPLLVELSELLGAAVIEAPSRAFLSFPMDHPLYQESQYLTEADVVVAIEATVPWPPGPRQPKAGTFVAVIDSDPIKLRIPTYEQMATLRLQSDARQGIQALLAAVRDVMPADRSPFAARTDKWARRSAEYYAAAERDALAASTKAAIDPRWLVYQIGRLAGDNAIVMDDTTHNRLFPFLRLSRPGSYFHNPSSGGGWGPGAGFGAKLAAPERDVIVVTGDGFYGFGSATAALWCAAHHRAPFLSVVLQNRSYATGTVGVAATYPNSYAAKAGFPGGYFDPPIDLAKEAEAAGAYGETVRDPGEVAAALQRGLAQTRAGKPAVIAVWLPRLLQND